MRPFALLFVLVAAASFTFACKSEPAPVDRRGTPMGYYTTKTATARDHATTASGAATAAADAKVPGSADLAAALPTLDELGLSGWSSGTSDDDTGGDNICDIPSMNDAIGFANVTFEQSAFGPFLSASLSSRRDFPDVMASLKKSFDGCSEWQSHEDDGSVLTYHVRPLSMDTIGDESYAMRASADGVPFWGTLQIDFVYWHRGPVGAVVAYVAAGPGIAQVSPLAGFVALVDTKVEALASQ